MPIPVQKMSQAKADLVEITAFIAEDNPEAAQAFLDAAEATFAFLASLPSVGRAYRGTRTIDAESPDFMRVQNQWLREIASLLLQENQALAALLSRRGPWVPLHSHRRLA